MIRPLFAACALFTAVVAAPALATDASVVTAVRTFAEIANDDERLRTFCVFVYVANSVGGDTSPETDGFSQAMTGLMKAQGPTFQAAWYAGDGLKYGSPDYAAYRQSLSGLAGKCPAEYQSSDGPFTAD